MKSAIKSTQLNRTDRAFVNSLGELLLTSDRRNDANTAQASTYGHISRAISAFVFNQTGVTLNDVNWHGYLTRADDVQAAIDAREEANWAAYDAAYEQRLADAAY